MTRLKIILNIEDAETKYLMVNSYYTVGRLMMRIKERFYNLHPSESLFLFFRANLMDNATIQPITKTLGEIYFDLGGPDILYVYVKREHTFG